MADDDLVLPYAERLVGCLCSQLALTPAGGTCQCCLRPGTAPPPADACCQCSTGNGQASVQIGPIFPVVEGKFPQRGIVGTLDNCTAYEWAVELIMVVYRCVSAADEKGYPSCEELTADTIKIQNDAKAMRLAALCCDWRGADDLGDPPRMVLGEWRPLNPMGGCAGGQMSVTVLLGSECCPEEVG